MSLQGKRLTPSPMDEACCVKCIEANKELLGQDYRLKRFQLKPPVRYQHGNVVLEILLDKESLTAILFH